jgi:hypothetical protein
MYECRKWETEHFNSVLEITLSFLRIHKWEPDNLYWILLGPSFAVHSGKIGISETNYSSVGLVGETRTDS